MTCSGQNDYQLNQRLLLLFGLWPSSRPRFERFQLVVTYVLILSLAVVQLLKFLTTDCNLELVLRILSTVLPSFVSVIRCCSFHANSVKAKEILHRLQADWKFLADSQEDIRLLQEHTTNGRNFTVLFAIFTVSGLVACTVLHMLPLVLDLAFPLNETRPRRHLVLGEYFVDDQTYFLPIFLHMMLAITIGMILVVATESLFTVFVLHSCGMFEIAGCRLERALEVAFVKRESLVYDRVVCAIRTHERAIELSQLVWCTFGISYFVQIATGVISMSVNLLRFVEAISLMEDIEEVLGSGMFIIAHLVYMMLDNYRGQYLSDHSSEIFHRAYNARWYASSVPVQKLYLFVMQASLRDIGMSCFSVFALSLEGFGTIISMSFSYFMVIYSARKE